MVLAHVREGVLVAFTSLRTNKLRSALTVLGVVIGVSTVMAMATIVEGIQTAILNALNNAAPNTFYIMRHFPESPIDVLNPPYEARIRPALQESDADAIRELPEIAYASLWRQVLGRLEYQGVRTQQMEVWGADDRYLDVTGGSLPRGRFFTRAELNGGAPVIVLLEDVADHLFGQIDPLGKSVRLAGRPLEVIGITRPPENMFTPPGQQHGGIIPSRLAKTAFAVDQMYGLVIAVRAVPSVSVNRAQDLVTVALRRARGLRPGTPNTFGIITQEQLLEVFSQLTSAFLLVMVALSGVALLVGGIGVMGIMMVSVTDRTREIGLRKAVGARRSEILLQFLVEAATLTLMGGVIGIVVGLGVGEVVKPLLGVEAGVPLWSAVLAAIVSIGIGLVFGLVPANRAAKMDPVEALRHE